MPADRPKVHPLAGKKPPASMLVDLAALERAYYHDHPDPSVRDERVAFGTSGHRGSSLRRSFNEDHIACVAKAICEHRKKSGIDGPLFLGMDTHALSLYAHGTVLEVLAAEGVEVFAAEGNGFTPTPVVSHAILAHNRQGAGGRADGIVVTPSHNPPEDGGIKYDPPHGGPAEGSITREIEDRANQLLENGLDGVRRVPLERALRTPGIRTRDFVTPYVNDLPNIVDVGAIARARLRIGVDPLGGASLAYWEAIAARHGLDLTVLNPVVDKTFGFMPLDHDGKIRTDCSSAYAMANLIANGGRFDIAFGNDADADRHGIVSNAGGLMSPNQFLSVAIDYLLRTREKWSSKAAIGKTMVSSRTIDRVVSRRGRSLVEVPVGFKWFVQGLQDGTLAFGGEESAGASFGRRDGQVWTTDKDGLVLDLLAAEILATVGKDPYEIYRQLEGEVGASSYVRIDERADTAMKARITRLQPGAVKATALAGDPITVQLDRAPGNGEPLGGLKVETANAWFAVRPSGTEEIYKLYAESFRGKAHLEQVVAEARDLVADAVEGASPSR